MLGPSLDDDDESWQRRTARYAGLLASVMLAFAVLYHLGMTRLEGETVSFLHSLQIVVETFTTTGYGSDSPWTHPLMNVLVIVMDVTGVVLVFLALPLLLFPLFEEAVTTTPPTSVDEGLSGHVVLCGLSGRGETFIEELEAWNAEYVVVEPDRGVATDLHEAGVRVVYGDPDSPEVLEAARAGAADAVVADVDDETNASVVLTCREVGLEGTVVAFAEDPDHAEYIRYAGANEVLTPRHLLGESLAEKVSADLSPELADLVEVDGDFDVAELTVRVDSDLEGRRLAGSGIRERTGADVIGLWRDGVLDPSPEPDAVLESGTILLVAGRTDQLEQLKDLTSSRTLRRDTGEVVVVGDGEVGRTVCSGLASAGIDYTVVDREDGPRVDVVGDAREAATLQQAGVEDAGAVVLALPDDTATIFSVLVLRELAPGVEVVARSADPDNLRKLYLAGADYALALETVSGRMLASTVLDEVVIAPDKQVDVVRCEAPALVGQTLSGADIRSRTGATVVAIERNGQLLADLDADTRVEAGDELVVAGSDDGINAFIELSRA